MSNRQLDERPEEQREQVLANALGISVEELQRLDYTIEPHTGADDAHYGYTVTFGECADHHIVSKIPGAVHGQWVRVGLIF